MFEGTDLYTILIAYANKNNSPYIKIAGFIDYLGKAARKFSQDYPAWQKWAKNTAAKFRAEISLLVEDGKCELLPEPGEGQIYLSSYFPEKIRAAYARAEESVDIPFPNEESLGISLPENQVKHLNSDYDLLSVLVEPKDNNAPVLKICFPENFGFAILPFDMFPRQITEIALLKVRNYISRYGNKEYVYHQLAAQLQGKEAYLKDQLEQILIKPMDQYRVIGENREMTSLFWTHLCGLIKNDIKKKKEKLTTDIAVFQAVYIIEVINSFFRSTAAKRREVEAAFRNLESQLAKPPYLYTMDQILKFSGPGGGLLLGQYTADELSEWMKRRITESKNDELPALLIVKVKTRDEQQYFLLKDKVMPLCARLLNDGKILIRRAIAKQWSKLISDFETDLAMTYDGEFEKLLAKTAEKLCPELMSLLSDPKFFLLYQEMDNKENGIPAAMRIIYEGKLLPYSSVFLIRRKAMLQEAKFALPFWFSLPIIPGLIGFLKNLFKKEKKAVRKPASGDEQVIVEEKDHAGEIRMVAEKLEFDIVPPGYTIDGYLEELADRWSRLLDSQARETLINDVKFLTKKQLRRRLKVDKQFEPTREALNQMAYDMVIHNAALSSLSARDSLLLFMELYMIKLLLCIK
jgi:hypothetical protein